MLLLFAHAAHTVSKTVSSQNIINFPLVNRKRQKKNIFFLSLKFHRSRRLRRDVVQYPVDPLDLVDDAHAHPVQQLIGNPGQSAVMKSEVVTARRARV